MDHYNQKNRKQRKRVPDQPLSPRPATLPGSGSVPVYPCLGGAGHADKLRLCLHAQPVAGAEGGQDHHRVCLSAKHHHCRPRGLPLQNLVRGMNLLSRRRRRRPGCMCGCPSPLMTSPAATTSASPSYGLWRRASSSRLPRDGGSTAADAVCRREQSGNCFGAEAPASCGPGRYRFG